MRAVKRKCSSDAIKGFLAVQNEVAYDIEQLYNEGEHPTKIARNLGIPLSLVYDWLEGTGVEGEEELSPHNTINS